MHRDRIETRLIAHNHSTRGGQRIRYIVVHDTGNPRTGADARAHARYFGSGNKNASAHYFVDDQRVVQIVADERASWHCGDGRGRRGITNQNSIGVELCIHQGSDSVAAQSNLRALVRDLMLRHNVPITRVVRHFDASGKLCPRSMSARNWEAWHAFVRSL